MDRKTTINQLFDEHGFDLIGVKFDTPSGQLASLMTGLGAIAEQVSRLSNHKDEGAHVVQNIKRDLRNELISHAVFALAIADLLTPQESES